MLNTSLRTAYNEDHSLFRETVRKVFAEEMLPHLDRWEQEGDMDRRFWKACGAAGLLCPTVSVEYGGPGLDFSYNAVVSEEAAYAGAVPSLALQSDVLSCYFIHYGNEEQKLRYLPKMVSGDCLASVAMTEPDVGSDLKGMRTTAHRQGDEYVINGAKTYISNGRSADVVVLAAKTDPQAGSKGISLILIDKGTPGFTVGRALDKVGCNAGGTVELFFSDVRVPVSNRLGEENRGFLYLVSQLPQERLSISVSSQAAAQRAFDEAVKFTKERKAFGSPIFDFQNTRFSLADLAAKLQVGWAHLDWAINRHVAGQLTPAEGAACKLWHTEMLWQVVDASLQLHGGAGYMNETAVARLWRDARVNRIAAGTTEIMKEVIGRTI